MRTSTTTVRRFEFTDISEDEAVVLRTLLNLNEEAIRRKLNGDSAYWDDRMGEDEAVEIGVRLCQQVMGEVDE